MTASSRVDVRDSRQVLIDTHVMSERELAEGRRVRLRLAGLQPPDFAVGQSRDLALADTSLFAQSSDASAVALCSATRLLVRGSPEGGVRVVTDRVEVQINVPVRPV